MRFLPALILILSISSCTSEEHDMGIVRGFYHWKTDFNLSEDQKQLLDELSVTELYVRYFDVDMRQGEALPIAEINIYDQTQWAYIITPVVFITPDVFVDLDSSELKTLASKIEAKLSAIHENQRLNEIQIDCDWTPSIQDKYFYFLEEFKKLIGEVKLSATVRLYQYKYFEVAGVPPVDKGLLMYYNMGNLTDFKEPNSILNNGLGFLYLDGKEYPLPIDIALPNFQWCLHYKNSFFEQICPNFTEAELKNQELFIQGNNDIYTFKKDTVMHGVFFRFGDQLRHEYCSEEDLLNAAKRLKEKINQDETRVLIYDLQPNTPDDYEKIDAVFTAFE